MLGFINFLGNAVLLSYSGRKRLDPRETEHYGRPDTDTYILKQFFISN